jgi:GDP-L-fucose synthase
MPNGTTKLIPVMPTTLYGPNDNFDLETSNVLLALIRKFHEAKQDWADTVIVIVLGTGSPRREFLRVDDLADACCLLMNMDFPYKEYKNNPLYNIGTGKDISTKELAEVSQGIIWFQGRITFDTSKPDGTPRKLLDVSRMRKLGWQPAISLEKGVRNTYG